MSEHVDFSGEPRRRLRDRFAVYRRLGEGGQAVTFLGCDESSGRPVCLKELVVDELEDWKPVELFEREAEALRRLDHPAVPSHVAAFHETTDQGGERFVLVQEYVDGVDLAEHLERGTPFTEEELRRLAREMLELLADLHDRQPPVIHRDIKPSNILRREEGSYALVDFGAVRLAERRPEEETTQIGTVGYSPLEQLSGRVRPASDLYSLGATLVHLASRIHPSELPMSGTRLEFEERVRLSAPFVAFVRGMLEPRLEDRFESAGEALAFLRQGGAGEAALSRGGDESIGSWHPDAGHLEVRRDGDCLVVTSGSYDIGRAVRRAFGWTPVAGGAVATVIRLFSAGSSGGGMAAGVLPRFDLPGWLMLFSGAFLVLAAFFVWWTGPTVVEFDSEGYRKGLRSGSLEDLERVAVRDESVELQVADGRVLVADGLSSRDAELLGRDVRRAIEAFRGR